MIRKLATSYDVAKLAGVSQSAVSRVFSPTGSASKKTRDKVLKAAKDLGYKPNPTAVSLSLGRTQQAGIIITQYAQQNYPVALRSAVDAITGTGVSLLIQIVDSTDSGDEALRQLLEKRVDFIVSAASLSTAAAEECKMSGVPLVLINRSLEKGGVDIVRSPNAGIMHQVAKLLFESGARKTLFLGGGNTNWISTERRRGYCEACQLLAMPAPTILEGDFTYDFGIRAVLSVGEKIRDIDAIVAANDPMALGALDCVRLKLGMAVPKDIQIIGHDDTEAASYLSYQLTSIRQDMQEMFARAIALATERLENPDLEITVVEIPNKLIARDSTRTTDC